MVTNREVRADAGRAGIFQTKPIGSNMFSVLPTSCVGDEDLQSPVPAHSLKNGLELNYTSDSVLTNAPQCWRFTA